MDFLKNWGFMSENTEKSMVSEGEANESLPSDTKSPPSPDEDPACVDIEAVHQELEAKREEARLTHDKYLRLAAEFDNYKRRSQRDQADGIRFANERLVKDLLPTLDNLERAIQSGQEQASGSGLLEGVQLTHKQFLETLTKLGVHQISSIGEVFDPSKHQAVAQVESEAGEPNTVVEEFQKGYFLHERIIRPAMVSVVKSQPDQETITNSETSSAEGGAGA